MDRGKKNSGKSFPSCKLLKNLSSPLLERGVQQTLFSDMKKATVRNSLLVDFSFLLPVSRVALPARFRVRGERSFFQWDRLC